MSHQAFEAAILANPADQTARLVYADWVDDQGIHPEFAAALRAEDFTPYIELVHQCGCSLLSAWAFKNVHLFSGVRDRDAFLKAMSGAVERVGAVLRAADGETPPRTWVGRKIAAGLNWVRKQLDD